MMRPRVALATIVTAVLLASCGGRPDVTVTIAGATVRMLQSSVTEGTRCSTMHGDGFVRDVPLTTVRTTTPLSIQVDAGQTATAIRGWMYDVDAPTPAGGPIEEFTLPGRSGTHQSTSIVTGRTYEVFVNVVWSMLLSQGEVTHVFRVRVESP